MDGPEALLFDLGDVLVEIDFQRSFSHWGRQAGCAPQALARNFEATQAYQRHERGEISTTDYFDTLRRSLDLSLNDEQMLEGWNSLFVGEMPGVRPLLAAAARQFPLYAFSNTNAAHADFFLPAYADLLRPLKRIFLSHEIGMRKPEAQAFRHVAQQIGLPPGRIAFFDDLAENVEAARAAGFQAWHVPHKHNLARCLSPLLDVAAP
jgi:putative hydrolase of the HAD superfamily